MAEISLKDALEQFLKKSRLSSKIHAIRIEEIWEEIMGKTVAKYTEKIQIGGDKLFISTSVGPLKNELIFQKDLIRDRVNEKLGEKVIKEVIIK